MGDTIRVSLTEPPENEIPAAQAITAHFAAATASEGTFRRGQEALREPFAYSRRLTASVGRIGGDNPPLLRSELLADEADALHDGRIAVIEAVGPHPVEEWREAIVRMDAAGDRRPVILKRTYPSCDRTELAMQAAADFGVMFIDGLADGIWIESAAGTPQADTDSIALDILQASRARMSKTEFISCPGCGRTLYALQDTLAVVKERLSHLKGLKIAVMGCIVNGPGEMADADYGYVGSRTGPDHPLPRQGARPAQHSAGGCARRAHRAAPVGRPLDGTGIGAQTRAATETAARLPSRRDDTARPGRNTCNRQAHAGMKTILPLTYLGSTEYFRCLYDGTCVIDLYEHYVKQSYRNRCDILTAGGPASLTVHVVKGGSIRKRPVCDMRIDYSKRWQHQHWMSILSAYRNSPYFDHYRDRFEPFYNREFTFLADWNIALLETVTGILGTPPALPLQRLLHRGRHGRPRPAPRLRTAPGQRAHHGRRRIRTGLRRPLPLRSEPLRHRPALLRRPCGESVPHAALNDVCPPQKNPAPVCGCRTVVSVCSPIYRWAARYTS